MLSKGRKMWIQWLLMIAILISGCGPPITTRLVSIDLEKESEADIQSLRTIGVLPLSSPDPDVGTRMAGEIANSLDSGLLGQGPFVARVIRPPKDFKLEATSLKKIGEKNQLDGLLLGEVSGYSVQASRDTSRMLALPKFGSGDASDYDWIGFKENPSITDTFYYRIQSLQAAKPVDVSITTVRSSLTVQLRLVEIQSGSILWEREIARNYERISLPGPSVETEDEVELLMASIAAEVGARLMPQESTVQRILRTPQFSMNPVAAKWVRRGIQAATLEDWQEAERLFLRAMKEAPDECSVNGHLGVAYEKNGRLLEAVAAYERAYRCQPRDPTYRYYSDDLQAAFVPDLGEQDLPILVLGVRADGIIYLNGSDRQSHHPGNEFTVYRTEVVREQSGDRIRVFRKRELARGRIVEVRQHIYLGQLLLHNPEPEVRSGDLIRFD
ncbi:MAG: tetratricopeptide repeat protein [Deltaproteobacteria bacterium]|nr:tetratricopeptide repeat protein [Deltaproteobacteria bacterium]